jgi:hypothetical protein
MKSRKKGEKGNFFCGGGGSYREEGTPPMVHILAPGQVFRQNILPFTTWNYSPRGFTIFSSLFALSRTCSITHSLENISKPQDHSGPPTSFILDGRAVGGSGGGSNKRGTFGWFYSSIYRVYLRTCWLRGE